MKLDDLTEKEFPSQTENRKQWILDTVRENKGDVVSLLFCVQDERTMTAKFILDNMHKADRDARLQSGGILTDKQIKELKG